MQDTTNTTDEVTVPEDEQRVFVEKDEEQEVIKPKSNPNKANQFILDPRQKLCWDLYINPKSDTFGNATQSAIKAGYTVDTADVITNTDWFSGRLRRLNMLGKAEKVLDEMLTMDAIDSAEKKIKQDTAKFIAERLGKLEGYSARTEVTGENGEPLALTMVINAPKSEDGIQPDEEAVPSVELFVEPRKD